MRSTPLTLNETVLLHWQAQQTLAASQEKWYHIDIYMISLFLGGCKGLLGLSVQKNRLIECERCRSHSPIELRLNRGSIGDIVPKSLAISSVGEISFSRFGGERRSALDGLPARDWNGPSHPLLPRLAPWKLREHDRVHLSYLTVLLLPVRPIYHRTPKQYWFENVL